MKKPVVGVVGTVGDPVVWAVDGVTTGVVTDRTKSGQFRNVPDKRGYVLVDWGGYRRWCTQLELVAP